MRLTGACSAVLVLVAAIATGFVAPDARATDTDHRDACEERCDHRSDECESKAETAADECTRKIESDPEWGSCGCGEPIGGKRSERCERVCTKSSKAATKCQAKLEKALERCEDHESTCSDRCD